MTLVEGERGVPVKQQFKSLFPRWMTVLCFGSLLTTAFWFSLDDYVEQRLPAPQKKSAPKTFHLCRRKCKKTIKKVLHGYSQDWQKHEDNYIEFRSLLRSNCSGFDKAIITQANTPVGSRLVYDVEKKKKSSHLVSRNVFHTFTKEHPFSNKTWDTCAVVGNGGILSDSNCGESIDSAQFVMRCNLPPLGNDYKHVGVKTDLVTANPSIFMEKYGSLMNRRRPFVESLRVYGNSLLLLPTFCSGPYIQVGLRAAYTIEEFGIPMKPVYFHPQYLQRLAAFWHKRGLRRSAWLSTGLIMASMALEVCENVHLYGFWPFTNHPFEFYDLKHHYYDNRKYKRAHAMTKEFELLLQLHRQGVLKLHLGECQKGKK